MGNYHSFSIIFLALAMLALPMLYIYAKRDPDPRLRPTTGGLFFACLLVLVACLIASYALAYLLGTPPNLNTPE